MIRRKHLEYLINRWTKYEEYSTNSEVRTVVKSFIKDLEAALLWDDAEEQEALDKMSLEELKSLVKDLKKIILS